MGQYLAMGLAHEIIISLDELKSNKISKKELRQGIEESLLIDLKLYDETETKKYRKFTLKNQVLETDLIPFLEVLYPKVYEGNSEHYHNLLEKLRSTSSTTWVDLAREKSSVAFQFDDFAESYDIEFAKPFNPTICLNFNYLVLYYGYGKIVTEGIYDFLSFFNHCIHETFKEHPIVKSIQVYITG